MNATRNKRLLAMLIFTLLAGVWLSVAPVEAQSNTGKKITKENGNFTVSVEFGIDGWFVYDTPVAVSMTIESKENFIGTLRVIPETDFVKTAAYGEDISLTAGESKTFSVVLPNVNSYGKIKIELLDEKGKIVYGETNQVTPENIGSKIAIGVLSDDYSALSYLDGIAFSVNNEQKMTSILELTKDSLPEESSALAALQYIVIDNFDTAQLSDEQYEALKDWTKRGGVLILALGSNYQNILHCFKDDFVTGTIGSLGKKELEWKIPAQMNDVQENTTENAEAEETDENTEEGDKEGTEQIGTWKLADVDCVDFELNDGEELTNFAEGKTAYHKNLGKGNIVVLSYALGMEPLTGYEDRANVAYSLLQSAWVDATNDSLMGYMSGASPYSDGYTIADAADENAKPSTILYAIILIAYAVFIGPVLYLILKAGKKREKIWVAIPAVTLVFTGIIYMTGFIYRINKPLLNTFSLISLENEIASEKIYTNIICPKAQEYSFDFKADYSGFQNPPNYYDSGMLGNTTSNHAYDYMIKKSNNGMELFVDNTQPFEKTQFAVNKTGENNIGSLDYDLHCYTTGFEGTVTNNTCYDLTGVVVVFETKGYIVGDLKKGEQATIDSSKLIGMTRYDALASTYYNHKDLYTNRELYIAYLTISMMENSVIDKTAYQQGYIWANIGSYKPDMMDGTGVKQSGCGVIYQTYTAQYEDVKGTYYPSIDQMMLSVQGEYDPYDRMLYSAGDVTVTYSFENYPGITSLTNISMSEKIDTNTYYKYADVYAYNSETGNYEQIFVNGDTLSGTELNKYMSSDILLLKYVRASDEYTYYMPKISARGDE